MVCSTHSNHCVCGCVCVCTIVFRPFVDARAQFHGMNLMDEIGFAIDNQNEYKSRPCIHMDAYRYNIECILLYSTSCILLVCVFLPLKVGET